MPFDVEMPDGTVIEDVPDGTTKEQILQKYQGKTEPKRPEWSDLPGNILPSAGRFASGIGQALSHPIQTAGTLLDAAAGGLQNSVYGAFPSLKPNQENFFYSPQAEKTADAVGQLYKDRYGGLDNLRNTIITDPVGFSADVSTVSGLTGAGLRAGGLTKAADVAQTVSNYTNPLYLAAKGTTSIVKPIYKAIVAKTSGVGPEVVAEQLRGSPELQSSMDSVGNKFKRAVGTGGEFTPESKIVENAQDSLDAIRQSRGNAYREKLANLKNANQEIPIDDIKNLANQQLERFNVKKTPEGLDFSRSTASGKSASEIEEVYNLVQDWGSKPGDTTPAMLDVLKRRLDDFYSEGRTSRAMVTTLKKSVQDKLVQAVPEYAEMTKDYAKATDLIKNMERALGAGDKTSADTAIRRLTMALREDKSLRRDLLTVLDEAGQKNVTGSVAGALSRPWITKSLESTLAAGAFGGAAAYFASPYLAALIPLASPRVVGELNVVLGKIGRSSPSLKNPGLAAYQAGRLPQQ